MVTHTRRFLFRSRGSRDPLGRGSVPDRRGHSMTRPDRDGPERPMVFGSFFAIPRRIRRVNTPSRVKPRMLVTGSRPVGGESTLFSAVPPPTWGVSVPLGVETAMKRLDDLTRGPGNRHCFLPNPSRLGESRDPLGRGSVPDRREPSMTRPDRDGPERPMVFGSFFAIPRRLRGVRTPSRVEGCNAGRKGRPHRRRIETIFAVPRALWGVNTPSRMETSMAIGRLDRQNARR